MPDPPGPWDIRNLADLVLGPGNSSDPRPPAQRVQPAAPVPLPRQRSSHDDDATEDVVEQIVSNVVLVNPDQNVTDAVSRYADYWSNRGQTVAVAWIDESGIKMGLFDYLRRVVWATEIVDALELRCFEELPELIESSVRRVVIAIVTHPGWETLPFVECCSSACVLVEPSLDQVIRAYESLKYLAQTHARCRLSCFVQEALSARQATELSTRLQHMGSRFLGREIDFEGFSLCEQWPTSNLVAETFIGEDGKGSTALLQRVLLDYVNPGEGEPEVQSVDSVNSGEKQSGGVGHDEACGGPRSVLPTVRPIKVRQQVQDVSQFDRLIGEVIEEICDDVVESWPIYSSSQNDYRLRWVFRKDGARTIVASAIDCPHGVLERAAAHLYPARDDDEIIVLARCLTTDHRKAAQNMDPRARLYEVSQMPSDPQPTLLLKEVTTAVG